MNVTLLPVVASRIPTTAATTGWSVSCRLTVPVNAPPVGSRATLIPGVLLPLVTVTNEPSLKIGAPPGAPTLKNFVTNLGADTRTLYTPGDRPRTRYVPLARLAKAALTRPL